MVHRYGSFATTSIVIDYYKLLHWIIDHPFTFLSYFANQVFHVGKGDLRIGVNILLDENLPVVGIARVVQQSALINVTLSSKFVIKIKKPPLIPFGHLRI